MFQEEEDDFGFGGDAEGWAPGAGAAAGVDLQIVQAVEAVGEGAVDAGDEEAPRPDLALMRVAGELEGDAGLLGDGEVHGAVGEEDAGVMGVQVSLAEDGAQFGGVAGFGIVHADDLKAVEDHFFVVQDAKSHVLRRVQVHGPLLEFVVISGDVKDAARGGIVAPRGDEFVDLEGGAVEHVAADEDGIGFQGTEARNDVTEKIGAKDSAEMQIGDEGNGVTAP